MNNLLRYMASACSIGACMIGYADPSSAPAETSPSTKEQPVTPNVPMDNPTNPTMPMERTITPNVTPVIQHGFDVFINADFLYWTGRVDNLNYAATGIGLPSTFNSQTDTPHGHVIGLDHKFSPGFKVGIGCNLGHDGWDTALQYTWLHANASSNKTFTSPTTSLWSYSEASIFFGSGIALIGSADTNWRLHFNNIDWDLGRAYFVSPHLILRPHIGLKGSWQKQTYSNIQNDLSLYNADADFSSPLSRGYGSFAEVATGSYSMYQEQYFWGLGIRAGLDTSWQFNRNWSIFGDFALATLWSQFTTTRVDHSSEMPLNPFIPGKNNLILWNQTSRTHTMIPVIELDLGVRWDYWFLDDDYRIRIQAAWENQVWFNQNHLIYNSRIIGALPKYANLTFQGLTLAFRLDF